MTLVVPEDRYPAEYWFSCYSHFDLESSTIQVEEPITAGKRLVYYDVETQKLAEEVGGWDRADLMLISIAVTYAENDGFKVWYEKDVPAMIQYMSGFDKVVSFNGDNFDSKVLSHYGDVSPINKRSFDVAQYLSFKLKHRIKLDSVATATLNVGKSADGLEALKWWKEGRIQEIIDYCKQDVQVLRDVVEYGVREGHVKYFDRGNKPIQIEVNW
ncbi:3'-5' exonuclease [bacterium]|nr:3'-5' exonuclease [bacterium]NUN44149.1 ribonuclease H-like domain-containing protein [bacterium]